MKTRDFLLDELRRELVGPTSPEEVLEAHEAPRIRYGAGILFPREIATLTLEENSAGSGTEGAEGSSEQTTGERNSRGDRVDTDSSELIDGEINRANDYLPSAMGLSAYGDLTKGVTIHIEFAQYLRLPSEGAPARWQRTAKQIAVFIPASELLGKNNVIIRKSLDSADEAVSVSLRMFVRSSKTGHNARLFTISLLNDTSGIAQGGRSDHCLYQCGIRAVLGTGDEDLQFSPLPSRDSDHLSKELLSLELLYRHRLVYAVGHGVAPDWTENVDGKCTSINTEVVPDYEVKPIVATSIENLSLRMSDLSKDDRAQVMSLCDALAAAYGKWIQDRETEASDPNRTPERLKETAQEHLQQCRKAYVRIQRGISILKSDRRSFEAFSLMNRAMLQQQVHYKEYSTRPRGWIEDGDALVLERPFLRPELKDATNTWRPFQLAFILMTIPSIVMETAEDERDRDLVDVIWFPTGGGKTEAYLGAAAFTILWRRLSKSNNAGCTVLMRYTLRLLTTQQFERAATLICALEVMRQHSEGARLGSEPITIGLWVGDSVTPNKKNDAVVKLRQLAAGQIENPFLVLKCPWCGARMGPLRDRGPTKVKGYKKRGVPQTVVFQCEDPDCDFCSEDGLPLRIIDEEIYEHPPTLLVGTVDKFALLPWYPEARSLFGFDRDFSPPDLIIQDELHLISGPLGSMVGHYETLIDEFCKRSYGERTIGAKIVASTATISRAAQQIAALYGRPPENAVLFPSQGLRAGDSFFAEEDRKAVGRRYAGVFATGLPSQVTAQVRVIGSLLQSPLLSGGSATEIDPYWTLMVYFNSIRELGHAATLMSADIPEYLRVLWRRFKLRPSDDADRSKLRRFVNRDLELTSRITNSEVTRTLDQLFKSYNGKKGSGAIDVCLATNMIQVGLDVSRLGLMVVVGQPKTTAEYIQATSRVGRDVNGPGLVVTVLNTGKPRDRSHYEHFRDFHQSIYRHVEPTSVTPFSIRVAERALHALLVALLRFQYPSHRSFPVLPAGQSLQMAGDVIRRRVSAVDPSELPQVELILNQFVNDWREGRPDVYGSFGSQGDNTPLMNPAGRDPDPDWLPFVFRATPSSMRNVDADCEIVPIYAYEEDANS